VRDKLAKYVGAAHPSDHLWQRLWVPLVAVHDRDVPVLHCGVLESEAVVVQRTASRPQRWRVQVVCSRPRVGSVRCMGDRVHRTASVHDAAVFAVHPSPSVVGCAHVVRVDVHAAKRCACVWTGSVVVTVLTRECLLPEQTLRGVAELRASLVRQVWFCA